MKANRNHIMKRDDRAEVGVGTLIVFIAMVLVAAVAAAVLINTSGTLQERAQATGKEATQEVSSNLKVVGIYGERTGTTSADKVETLQLNVELSAGAQNLDLTQLIIRYSDGTNAPKNYEHSTVAGATYTFATTMIRGTAGSTVMTSGDLVEVEFGLDDGAAPVVASWYLDTRTNVEITLIPEFGSAVQANFRTPPTYGTSTAITLR